jgi:ketosteroid isomerase-like protein
MHMLKLMIMVCFGWSVAAMGQQTPEQQIRKLMEDQQNAWNRGDVDAFMEGYWKSDSLLFIGSNGVTYGYHNTLIRYKKTYDSREKMGALAFELLHLIPVSAEAYLVVGKWNLTRTIGNIGGYYTLVFRKINGQWRIVSDHTS